MLHSFVTRSASSDVSHSVAWRFLRQRGRPRAALVRRGLFLSRSARLLLGVIYCAAVAQLHANVVTVRDDVGLRQAIRNAGPGTQILIAPGQYEPGVSANKLVGNRQQPIVIAGSEPKNPPRFVGGNQAWHLSDCAYLTLRNIAVQGQRHNGINVDDGGSFDTPSHHITLESIRVSDIGPEGNFDAIKLSGVQEFVIRSCEVTGWGGQSVDMVGCHRGLIERCMFRGKEGFSQATGVQTKGGTSGVTIRRCLFLEAGARAVNIGGSTGPAFFRPQDAPHEAQQIIVEGCAFVGSQAPIAFVGVDGATVRYNTFYRPGKWVMRILQESNGSRFVACRNGVFTRNLIVFHSAQVRSAANVGPNTQPETFRFADNLWYCADRPGASRPQLPTKETGGVYGIDPQLRSVARREFAPRNKRAASYGATAWQPSPKR